MKGGKLKGGEKEGVLINKPKNYMPIVAIT